MATIEKEMAGDLDFAGIAKRIRDEEIGRREFIGARTEKGLNYVNFRKSVPVPDGKPIVMAAGDFPPVPAYLLWTGGLRVQGKDADVSVFRPLPGAAMTANSLMLERLPPVAAEDSRGMLPIAADAVVARAMSALENGTVYDSPGISPPLSAERWPAHGARIDCSGFVAWCLRLSRKVDHPLYLKANGGWFETTAIHLDGVSQTGLFSQVEQAVPGSLLVYPDRVVGKKLHQGHIGVVLKASGNGIAGVKTVIHCASSSYEKFGDAIRITGPDPWLAREDAIIVRYDQ